MKIHIIGCSGSGKTYFANARSISQKVADTKVSATFFRDKCTRVRQEDAFCIVPRLFFLTRRHRVGFLRIALHDIIIDKYTGL